MEKHALAYTGPACYFYNVHVLHTSKLYIYAELCNVELLVKISHRDVSKVKLVAMPKHQNGWV